MRTLIRRSVAGLAALAMAAPGAAQRIAPEPPARAWLGFGYDVRWVQVDGSCRSEVIVETLVQGAPAERAGLRPGDALLALDDQPVSSARLPLLAARLAPGDSVRLRVSRGGQVRELVAVADRRPARPPASPEPAGASGLYRSSAPIVELDGEAIVARNLDEPGRPEVRGYWVRADGDRTEWRRLSSRSASDLDRRVRSLLVCADSLRWDAEPGAVAHVEVRRIRDRADSLRVLIARRALERQESDGEAIFRVLEDRARAEASGSAPPVYALRLDDHLSAAERGVAGAELTPLEPDLADYFRGVREGLLVLRVTPNTPADRAGLRAGDVITDGAGRSVRSVGALRLLLSLPDATPLELGVVRHGRSRTLTIPRDGDGQRP